MKPKYISVLIVIFVFSQIGWTFYEQHKASEMLSEISKTSHDEINSIMIRNPTLGKWVVLQHVPETIHNTLFSALSNSKGAMGYRTITPYENLVVRIKTEDRVLDFDFLYHKQEGKWVKFDLVSRDYFGASSFTQEHYGSFKSKDLVEFLQFVENES
ncbi:hypothetical protein GCM10009128_23790 [Psychrosphaera haliotis]|uniref:hypothetical protein n=1 Tax=Psychrosphaera haliotis TaxID=555083 RepID=UPI0031DF2BA6